MSVVDEDVVWVSGEPDVVVRTSDGGESWTTHRIGANDSLMVRDVHGFSADEAIAASLGPGSLARLYRTEDAGASWSQVLQATDPNRSFDCFSFWDHRGFMAVSSDEGLVIMTSGDSGRNWSELNAPASPELIPGEHVAAASGTCALAGEDGHGWITTRILGTGTRVFYTLDFGVSWAASNTPVPSGHGREGLASAAFFDAEYGIAIGRVDGADVSNVAITNDGGVTWSPGGRTIGGIVFGASVVPGASTPTLVSVSRETVNQYSKDGGLTWVEISDDQFWTVSFLNATTGWAAGQSKISKISNAPAN